PQQHAVPRTMGALFALLTVLLLGSAAAKPHAGLKTWGRFSKLPYPGDKVFLYDTFPGDFIWAVGTAAYQVEGAFEKDGKGLSIWDTFTRGGNRMATGDVGSDSYHNVHADIRAIRQLGVSHYRFSLSWSRIFPNGTRGSYNEMGTNYYRTLIKKLKEIRVQPVVTLYHWDLPEQLQQSLGGWSNPELVEIFKDYADFCFQAFGDDVKFWITIDNPFVVAQHGYGTGVVAPGIKNDPDLPYRVGHNLLKAHAAAWHLYDRCYRPRQQGKLSMALASHWIKPRRTRLESLRECQCSLDHVLGWFARPLFTDGDYPPCMRERLGSRLPSFTQEEREQVRGTADFFALSHGATLSFQLINDSLKFGQLEDLDLRMLLYWVNAEYDKPPIFVVQSGWWVETTPTQFADPNIYLWNISNNGELIKLEGFSTSPVHRARHCADYATIWQQVRLQVGVNHFHFSLNWSALVPNGDVAYPNTTLLGYYRCFTRQLVQANVTPVVTLWHHTRQRSSLPTPLDTANRWLNSKTPQSFAEYARLCYRELGAHVKMWITLNEPNDEMVSYQEGHEMLRAHALAWHVYDLEFRPTQGGQVSLALHMDWVEPAFSFSREDVEPAKRVLDFYVGWFAEPVFGSGDYPVGMRSWLRQLNSLELPVFKEEDRQLIRGTYDFFAMSHFSTKLVTHAKEDSYTYTEMLEVQHMIDTTWIMSPRPVVPWGLRKALNWHYSDVPIYIMANGVQEDPARFKDALRVYYLYNYINEALKAFTLDGVNLKGYFAYALNDQRDPGFGLYGQVHQEVIVKASLSNYRNIIQHNGFPIPGAPQQQCPALPPACPGCHVLIKGPVVGFLTLVGSGVLITLGLIIYYTAKRHKEYY
uniref:Klotho n=1 Tax=Fundulus heteroclitus TaxID=8078 RepID=A0A3Q2NNQ7_FUNHE